MCVTNNITEKSLEKWKDLILACKKTITLIQYLPEWMMLYMICQKLEQRKKMDFLSEIMFIKHI